ncbi:MAG: hypothetical protein ACJAR1_001132 [Rubritalea sp.]|jgi:hypothetical protein
MKLPKTTKNKLMNTRNTTRSVLALASAAMLGSASLYGAAVIYEPFNYSDSDLSANTQTGLGLSGSWSDNGTLVTSTTLTYGSLATTGKRVTLSDDASGASTGSTLTGLLDDGDTLWFSVLVAKGAVDGNADFGFALGTDTGRDVNNVPLGTTNGGNGIGFRFKNGLKASTWSGGNSSVGGSGLSPVSETTYLIVGEMIFGATDTINLYLPDTDLTLGSIVSTQTATLDQTVFNRVTFMDKSSTPRDQVDEIRFGALSSDVLVTVPEPSTTALLGLGGLALLRRRRDSEK